jgi:integral membrane protein
MTRTGHLFSWIALAEAFTWAGLLIGMFVKYVLAWTEWGVWLFGRLHGGAFLIYCVMTIVAAIRLRWPWWATILAFIASIPPLATLPLERWFRRRGWLTARPAPAT